MIFSFLFLAAIVVWVDMLMGKEGTTKSAKIREAIPAEIDQP